MWEMPSQICSDVSESFMGNAHQQNKVHEMPGLQKEIVAEKGYQQRLSVTGSAAKRAADLYL